MCVCTSWNHTIIGSCEQDVIIALEGCGIVDPGNDSERPAQANPATGHHEVETIQEHFALEVEVIRIS